MECYRIAVVLEASEENLVLVGKCLAQIRATLAGAKGKAVIKGCREDVLYLIGSAELDTTRGAPEGKRAS